LGNTRRGAGAAGVGYADPLIGCGIVEDRVGVALVDARLDANRKKAAAA